MRRRRLCSVIGLVAVMFLLAGCSRNGRVTGVLVDQDGQPVGAQMALFRATEGGESEGEGRLEVAHQASTDSSGAFELEDVEPGNYVLGYLDRNGRVGFMMTDDGTAMFVIEVEAGQRVDLGQVLAQLQS